MKNFIILLTFSFISCGLMAQSNHNDLSKLSLYHKMYNADSVIDSTYGIKMYKKYNYHLGGDSVRNCNGYACNGWVEDYYKNKTLLHKGYYVDGQLRIFKNYYPNGNVERNFVEIDNIRSKMTLYFSSGGVKSKITYSGSNPIKWEDFYEKTGDPKYIEQYDKDYVYYKKKISYYDNQQMESDLELANKKKKLYEQNDYYKDGKIKKTGELVFSEAVYDYRRIGTWKYYDDSGKLTKTEKYQNGTLADTKTF